MILLEFIYVVKGKKLIKMNNDDDDETISNNYTEIINKIELLNKFVINKLEQ